MRLDFSQDGDPDLYTNSFSALWSFFIYLCIYLLIWERISSFAFLDVYFLNFFCVFFWTFYFILGYTRLGASQVELVVKDPSVNAGRPDRHGFDPWVGKISWKGAQQPISEFLSFPGSDGRQSACNVGELGSIPVLGRSPGGGHGSPLQYACLENPQIPQILPGQRSQVGYSS